MENRIKSIQLQIDGMTCISCQNKIVKNLKSSAGIESIRVSYQTGIAEVTYDENIIKQKDIKDIIDKLGYKVVTGNYTNLKNMVSLLAIIVSLYVLLSQMGILNLLVPSQLAESNMGYGMLFVIGLVTSVHCIAMCGGINLSQCIPTGEKQEESNWLQTFKPAFLYNFGRVISYTVIGFLLGGVGSLFGGGASMGIPVFAQGILKLIAGAFMVIMGINMLGIVPVLRKLQPRMPQFLATKIGLEKAKSNSQLVVGLFNGLMPCGPLQSMQIVALASGNPVVGALSMFFFSLGTVPLMLGLGSIVSAFGQKFTKKVMTIGAVLVVVLGLAMFDQGGSLSGLLLPNVLLTLVIGLSIIAVIVELPLKKQWYKTIATVATIVAVLFITSISNGGIVLAGTTAGSSEEITIVEDKQIINSTLSSRKYPSITVQVGTPVVWTIDAPEGSINGCNYQMNIPAFDIEGYAFETGENIIEFTPTETGTYQYSCWMGMIRATITVVEAGDAESASENSESDNRTSANNINEDTVTSTTNSNTNGDTATSNSATKQESVLSTPAGYTIPTDDIAVAKEILYLEQYPAQEVTIELTDKGFQPAVVVVESGLDVIWNIINSTSESNAQLLVPFYGSQLTLASGDNQLSFTPTDSFDFSNGDNSFYGYVKLVEELETVDLDSVKEEVSNFVTYTYPASYFQSNSGSSYSGSGYSDAEAATATIVDGVQYVTSTVSYTGYQPIRVQEGIPVKWTMNMPEDVLSYCNNSIYIPEYDITVDLKAGDNIIEFIPEYSGNFVYSCWMGMTYGNIIVEREDGTVDETRDSGAGNIPASCCG